MAFPLEDNNLPYKVYYFLKLSLSINVVYWTRNYEIHMFYYYNPFTRLIPREWTFAIHFISKLVLS